MKVHILHKSVVLIVFQKYILDILLIEGTRVRGHLGLPIHIQVLYSNFKADTNLPENLAFL